jgi:hypothetical protein
MKHYILPVLFIILTVYSCNSRKQTTDSIETISIDIRKMKPEMDITYAMDTSYFEIIPLETNEDCLIAEVTRFIPGCHFRNMTKFIFKMKD